MAFATTTLVVVVWAVAAVTTVAVFVAAFRLAIRPLYLRAHYTAQGVRGLPFRPLVGNISELRAGRNLPYGTLGESFRARYGPVYYLFLGPTFRLQIADPAMVKSVLHTHSDCWKKSPQAQRAFGDLLGSGLLLSEGELHARQRRTIAPAFRFARLQEMMPDMVACTADVVAAWAARHLVPPAAVETTGPRPAPLAWSSAVDVHKQLSQLTLRIIGRSAFGVDVSRGELAKKAATVYEDLAALNNSVTERLLSAGVVTSLRSKMCQRQYRRQLTRRVQRVKGMVREFVALKREALRNRRHADADRAAGEDAMASGDLLSILLTAPGGMSDEQVMHESMTFVLAGHETTSQLMTWAMYLLAKHPVWATRARLEIATTLQGRRPVRYEDLAKLKWVNAILLETLRLMPPAVSLTRQCTKGHYMGPISVAPGTVASLSIWGLHRSPALWDRPDAFDPSRFEAGLAGSLKHPMAFLPFGSGPRGCIGRSFAMLEARAMLVTMLQRVYWRLSDDYIHMPVVDVTLRPKHGLPLVFRPVFQSEYTLPGSPPQQQEDEQKY